MLKLDRIADIINLLCFRACLLSLPPNRLSSFVACSGGGNSSAGSSAAVAPVDDDDDDDDGEDNLEGGFTKAVREKERRQANNVRERYVMSTTCLPATWRLQFSVC